MDRRHPRKIPDNRLVRIVDDHADLRELHVDGLSARGTATSTAAWREVMSSGKDFVDRRVLERLRAEYLEMPGMKLRIEQVQRLCGIEPPMCRLVLDALVKERFLCLKPDGTYVRATEGRSSQRPAKAALRSTPSATVARRAGWQPFATLPCPTRMDIRLSGRCER
jgi:hypothetical protein